MDIVEKDCATVINVKAAMVKCASDNVVDQDILFDPVLYLVQIIAVLIVVTVEINILLVESETAKLSSEIVGLQFLLFWYLFNQVYLQYQLRDLHQSHRFNHLVHQFH